MKRTVHGRDGSEKFKIVNLKINKYNKMNVLKFRVHTMRNSTDFNEIRKVVKRYSIKYIMCLECKGLENEHVHGVIYTEKKVPAIRKALKVSGCVKGKGNGYYSIAVCKDKRPVELIAYVMKEGEYETDGMCEDLLNEARRYDEGKKKEKMEKKKRVVDIIKDRVREEHGEAIEYGVIPRNVKESILNMIIEVYIGRGVLFNKHKLVSVYQSVMCDISSYYKRKMIDMIIKYEV